MIYLFSDSSRDAQTSENRNNNITSQTHSLHTQSQCPNEKLDGAANYGATEQPTGLRNMINQLYLKYDDTEMNANYSRTPLIRPPSESHWCGRIRGMVAREGFVYEQKPLSVTRNVVV